jgi:hypothetical protein
VRVLRPNLSRRGGAAVKFVAVGRDDEVIFGVFAKRDD